VESYFDKFVLAGGIMMLFLIPTSIIAIALIIHGLIDLRREHVMPEAVREAFQGKGGEAPSLDERRERLERAPECPLRRVCLRMLAWAGTKDEAWDLTVQQVASEEIASLYQRHAYLSVVYGVAPLMGLLGTILGMIRAFTVFGSTDDRSISQLGLGISEALITTMWGLIIAVPALLFVSLFRQKIYRYENDQIPRAVRELFAGIGTRAPVVVAPENEALVSVAKEQ